MPTIITTPAPCAAEARPIALDPGPVASRWQRGAWKSLIMVASNGMPQSDGALRVAVERARRVKAALEVVTVLPHAHVAAAVEGGAPHASEAMRRDLPRRAVNEQLRRLFGAGSTMPVSLLEGDAAPVIAATARERGADLVIVGQGRHDMSDRIFHRETALELVRLALVPVLVVPADAIAAPHNIVAAVDLGELSTRIAEAAIAMASGGCVVELVHVMAAAPASPLGAAAREEYGSTAQRALGALVRHLRPPTGVTLRASLIEGDGSAALLAHVAHTNADLLVTGTKRPGAIARALVGSTVADLLRDARCAVLCVPERVARADPPG